MPNHYYTEMNLDFEKFKDAKRFLADAEKAKGNICHIAIPQPEILSRTGSGSTHIDGKIVNTWIVDTLTGKDRLPTAEEKQELARIGYDNWYDWANATWGTKWGTKWGTYDFEVREKDGKRVEVSFNSAWGPPCEGVYEALAKKYGIVVILCAGRDEFESDMHGDYVKGFCQGETKAKGGVKCRAK